MKNGLKRWQTKCQAGFNKSSRPQNYRSEMDLTINLVSSICWEIIAKLPFRLNNQTLPVFKLLLDGLYDFSAPFSESPWKIYWRRTPGDYLEITDYFSLCSFVNLAAVPELYLVIADAEKFYADTEKFLKMLDLMELKRVKELERSKYDLKSKGRYKLCIKQTVRFYCSCISFAADVIEEQIQECRKTLADPLTSTIEPKNDREVINFALRNMPMGRCYTADICSGYNLIDCVRKGKQKL